jgi:hypothetical protein
MSANNLGSLNDTLFDTLNKLKNGTIKLEEAKAINDIGSTIIHNAKLQLEVIKVTKNLNDTAKSTFGIEQTVTIPMLNEAKSLYDYKLEFSVYKGFKNIASCMSDLGTAGFDGEFRTWCKSSGIDLTKLM